ncbi:Fic family protein [Rufibacter sp. LB8]|uniref:Fic family protein n=1 Tax=Rufibacter sp. LB8 TaxID=2777781 RepID=UPI00351C1634
MAFEELYDWAGKYRTTQVQVGLLTPPPPKDIPVLLYQFVDNLNYKLSIAHTEKDHLEVLLYGHYEFVRIHPFNNGNGRTGRLLLNLLALKLGYQPMELYKREGDARGVYIQAMREADKGNFEALKELLRSELTRF